MPPILILALIVVFFGLSFIVAVKVAMGAMELIWKNAPAILTLMVLVFMLVVLKSGG